MQELLKKYRNRVDIALDSFLPKSTQSPEKLNTAMRYMVLNGSSKRIRPALVYMVGDELSADSKILDIAAASIEMLHIFSLIHDDLPCIDDSDLRYHRASCHKKFDEATAVLAGDALILYAIKTIGIIDRDLHYSEIASNLTSLITNNVIDTIAGEHLDIELTNSISDISQLEQIYQKKTAALISASAECGAIASGCADEKILLGLRKFGSNIGLSFQIIDDIIDVASSTEILGKPQGKDSAASKVTYPSLLGMDKSKLLARQSYDAAIAALESTGYGFAQLRQLADFILHRNY